MKIPIGQTIAIGRPYVDLASEIIAVILRVVIEGWAIARQNPKVHPEAMEVPMTECLREGMRQALVSLSSWNKTLIIAPGAESKSDPEMPIPDGRTDIPIYSWDIFSQTCEHDPHVIIECKRITESDSHLTREYIVEGMDRFRTGKYGGNHGKGFMVGYVLSGKSLPIVASINLFLDKHGRRSEHLKSSTNPGCEGTWTSRHPRAGAMKAIDLLHIMLDVGCSSSSRAG
ncbi:MAG TPA: hypothetical protein VI457_15535 [Methylococcaceae bacterium]|nr:hypothetical protein [Methylococcaceae bacterium]